MGGGVSVKLYRSSRDPGWERMGASSSFTEALGRVMGARVKLYGGRHSCSEKLDRGGPGGGLGWQAERPGRYPLTSAGRGRVYSRCGGRRVVIGMVEGRNPLTEPREGGGVQTIRPERIGGF